MQQMKIVKPKSESEKHTRTTVDTMELTPKLVASWKTPGFQRELKVNRKVMEVVEHIREDKGVLPGILTLGSFDGEIYVVDGQHRLQAFLLSDEPYGYADVRTVFFGSMAEMADEYAQLNSQLVTMRPDDKLRALEFSTPALQLIRKKCPFVGYDNVRRDTKNAPMLSMSMFVRCWAGSRSDTPTTGQTSAKDLVASLEGHDVENAIRYANICFVAWSRDREYHRLWSALNISITSWLFRRLVLGEGATGASRWTRFTEAEFRRGLMALSADASYLEWLLGRNAGERDRTPAYTRIRSIMAARYHEDTGKKALLPGPAWAHAK